MAENDPASGGAVRGDLKPDLAIEAAGQRSVDGYRVSVALDDESSANHSDIVVSVKRCAMGSQRPAEADYDILCGQRPTVAHSYEAGARSGWAHLGVPPYHEDVGRVKQ